MADETITPEEMERPFDPDKVDRYSDDVNNHEHPILCVNAADYDSLLASYRALQSENRIAMRALRMASNDTPLAGSMTPDHWMAEARAQEGK